MVTISSRVRKACTNLYRLVQVLKRLSNQNQITQMLKLPC